MIGPRMGDLTVTEVKEFVRESVAQSIAALLHESELARIDPDPRLLHRPMRYDIGLPSPVI